MSAGSRRRHFGLQARVIVTFAIGAALVSAVLALSTFYFVRKELISQRTISILHQTFANARLVKVELGAPSTKIGSVLSSVTTANGVHSFIYHGGQWYASSAAVSGTTIPKDLMRTVVRGNVADQRVVLDGTPTLAVGVPIPAIGVSYFEEHPLGSLASTLRVVATVLTTVAIATTIGGVLAGWLVSRRLVRPLGDIVSVATEIAGGTLDRRLPDDPDLRPLVVSFNEMVTALQQRIERDARFASDVTHELRSPLTTIGASVELLNSYRSLLPRGGAEAIDTLHVEVDRFSTMVQELLEMASIDAGAAVLHFTDVPIVELVELTVDGYDPSIPVSLSPDARDTIVRGDKRRLQQVLLNLLDNAETHGGGAVGVDVHTGGGWATISVDDAGPGIRPTERERVFERFYRGAASGRRGDTGGSGLGLALVAEHVRAHGGSVRVGDSAAGGARFSVVLPVEPR
ncbi:MAG: HAMP domain-containing sensor histidine kinase [Actinomycetota bacterium]|nr:HAMP domain-containing sensor histidine kinase [Actinomycetota bacterium]